MTIIANRNPAEEIKNNNAWYTDDQFKQQIENPAAKRVIEWRWDIFENAIRNFLDKINSSQPVKILDAGCGDGINLIGLNNIMNDIAHPHEIHGCDYNNLRLERAKSFPFVKSLLEVNLLKSDYKNDDFDIILCNHVLEHIPDMEGALKELRRILKPNGLLILNIPNEGCLMAQLRNKFFQKEILKTTDHVHFLTKRSFGKVIEKSQLTTTHWERRGFFFPHMYLLGFLRNQSWGISVENTLAKLFPSQGTDLIAITTKA